MSHRAWPETNLFKFTHTHTHTHTLEKTYIYMHDEIYLAIKKRKKPEMGSGNREEETNWKDTAEGRTED